MVEEETRTAGRIVRSEGKSLILPSFEIKNFRAFRHLKVERLGNVNLVVGKNNAGKTSLLEAMRIYSD